MSQQKSKNYLNLEHEKEYLFEISQTTSYCSNCSTVIITDKSGKHISTIKPKKCNIHQEFPLPTYFNKRNTKKIYSFSNDKDYIKIRANFVKNMKKNCKKLNLNLKTFFTALDYFDQICSIFVSFDETTFKQISDLCIILSAKLNENISQAMKVKCALDGSSNKNYVKDELYLLKILKYDLVRITSYDILRDILTCGFIFDDEIFQEKKMNSIYDKMENMLYLFSESKHWIYMSPKEIAMGIVGWARNFLGLIPFSKNIQIVFLNEFNDIHNYIKCFNKIKKCFKIKESKNIEKINKIDINNSNNNGIHSDSTKDSNSDNN